MQLWGGMSQEELAVKSRRATSSDPHPHIPPFPIHVRVSVSVRVCCERVGAWVCLFRLNATFIQISKVPARFSRPLLAGVTGALPQVVKAPALVIYPPPAVLARRGYRCAGWVSWLGVVTDR